MFISQFSHFTSAGGTFQETLFDKERLIHLFQSSGIFTQCRSNGSKPYRTAFEFINNGAKYLIIDFIESVLINIQCFKSEVGNLRINATRTFYLCKISHTTQQCICNTRRSTATGSDLDAALVEQGTFNIPAERRIIPLSTSSS